MAEWEQYFRITARKEYESVPAEVARYWDEERFREISSLPGLFNIFLEYRDYYRSKKISHYIYNLYLKLFVKIYTEKFQKTAVKNTLLEKGVFEYLSGNTAAAVDLLEKALQEDYESVTARIYLGFAYLKLKDQRKAIVHLSQNLYFAADQLDSEELYLSQFRLLFGRLHTQLGDPSGAAWLLTFESWYRNWLIIEEDARFFALMRKREQNERILQIKYTATERYRHFAHCLFIAEYCRLFRRTDKGLINEQENYMEKLDTLLYARYRKKRKPVM